MRKLLILPILLSLLFSCTKSVETSFKEAGVSFTIPAGWELTEYSNDEAHYAEISKEGLLSGSIVIFMWYDNDLIQPEMLINIMIDEMKKNSILEKSDMEFGEIYVSDYKQIKTKKLDYTIEILGAKMKGQMYSFKHGGKTFCIMEQGAEEELTEDNPAFDRLENTFSLDDVNNSVTE